MYNSVGEHKTQCAPATHNSRLLKNIMTRFKSVFRTDVFQMTLPVAAPLAGRFFLLHVTAAPSECCAHTQKKNST